MRKVLIGVAVVTGICASLSVGAYSASSFKDLPPAQRYTAEAVGAVAAVPLMPFVAAGAAWYEWNRPDGQIGNVAGGR
jgi:hypothetical protein